MSWRAPLGMLAALVAGVCLAAGHHAFYASLQGREVSSHQYRVGSWTASSQQINPAGGTAFAFVFKASMVYSLWWLSLFGRHFLSFIRQAGLLIVFDRLLPIAAIIAPAALSVTFAKLQYPPMSSQFVPQPAFGSVAFLSSNSYNTSLTGYAASTSFEPDQEVLRVASAAAASGSILHIQPPGMNASWQITIDAPKMVCENMDSDFQSQLKTNLLEGLQSSIQPLGEPGDFASMFSYLARSSWTNFTSDAQGNEVNTTVQLPFTNVSGPDMEFLAQPKNSRNDFYVAAFPRANIMPPRTVWDSINGSAAFGQVAMDWFFENATLLHCNQAAVRYDLGFQYDGADQEQHINVISSTDIEPSWQPGVEVAGQTSSLSVTDRYNLRYNSVNAIWATTVSLIVGASNDNSGRLGTAELWSFSPDVVGLFRRDYFTQVFSTSLADTVELAAITPARVGVKDVLPGGHAAPRVLEVTESLLSPSLGDTIDRQHLGDALEELLFNITISMASSPRLLYNESNPFAPPLVNVTLNLYGNIYDYDQAKLWLPYGLAIGVTVLNVAIGLFSMFQTGASFTANFSTIVRMAKNAEILSADTSESSIPGKDPLPKSLAQAKFAMRSGQTVVKHELHSVQDTKNYRQLSQTEDGESSR
ncbi:hypothetical protein PRZ48_003482 [Zasmidium cellare]|uniref:Uncharacterized protein n=1 Tax=Zasmidium cellare TaxID=395010 RepID=A0ABR0EV65_ZASCE|nr:hypothetical protein PRZ48_003482 [Zasmidium cellare]